MGKLGFSDDEHLDMTSMLAAILHLGNLAFTQNGGAQIGNEDVLQIIADLLAVDAAALAESLTSIKRELRGEVITTPLDTREVRAAACGLLIRAAHTGRLWIRATHSPCRSMRSCSNGLSPSST